jgi:hypothetical protein
LQWFAAETFTLAVLILAQSTIDGLKNIVICTRATMQATDGQAADEVASSLQ